MRAVDTNVVVRLIVRDDATQAEAADEFASVGAWISHLVLAETMWVLDAIYERTPQQIAAAIEMLLNHNDLTLQDADVVAAALDHFRKRPAFGFSNCLLVETARKAGHKPIGTFDRRLAKLPDVQLLR
jgi:predicted nucleic-acid-binding protein